jgi:hypothetical protein
MAQKSFFGAESVSTKREVTGRLLFMSLAIDRVAASLEIRA